MRSNEAGKGYDRRPMLVDREVFEHNWDRIFATVCGCGHKNYDHYGTTHECLIEGCKCEKYEIK